MRQFDDRFRFHETFTNTNGKTSGSGFVGVILGLISGAAFIAAMVGWFLEVPETIEVMGKILQLSFAAAALLGIRKVAPNFLKKHEEEEVDVNDEQIVDSKKG